MPIKSITIVVAVVVAVAAASGAMAGIPGTPDRVPAASLLVPFFETSATSGAQDTLLVVTNTGGSARRIHYQVWSVDGTPVDIQGSPQLQGFETFTVAMRDLLSIAPQAARDTLRVGDFFRGFVTIDTVTEATTMTPLQSEFPFSIANVLTGYIYYTRLGEGSANGLPMVHLEALPAGLDGELVDFYAGGGREEIDGDARLCAETLGKKLAADCEPDADGDVDTIQARLFTGGPLNGRTRVVIFAWRTFSGPGAGGPSTLCQDDGAGCETEYQLVRYNEAGAVDSVTTVELGDVVNVLEYTDGPNGWIELRDLPNVLNDLQLYAFSFNSAQPPAADLNWDAIFEATIRPD